MMKCINPTACFGAALVFLCWILPVSAEIQATDNLKDYRVKALKSIGISDSKAKSLIDGLMDIVHADRGLLNIPPGERRALLVSTVSNNDYEMFKAVWSLDGRWIYNDVASLLAVAEQREESREWVRLINASWDDLVRSQEYQALLDSIDRGFSAYHKQFHRFANALKEGDLPQYLRQRGHRGDLFYRLALNSDNSLFQEELGRWYVFLIDSLSSEVNVALGGISYEEMPPALRSARASMTAEELHKLIFKEKDKADKLIIAAKSISKVIANTVVMGVAGGLGIGAVGSLTGGFVASFLIDHPIQQYGEVLLSSMKIGITVGASTLGIGALAGSLVNEFMQRPRYPYTLFDFFAPLYDVPGPPFFERPRKHNSGACKNAISGYLKQRELEAVPL